MMIYELALVPHNRIRDYFTISTKSILKIYILDFLYQEIHMDTNYVSIKTYDRMILVIPISSLEI